MHSLSTDGSKEERAFILYGRAKLVLIDNLLTGTAAPGSDCGKHSSEVIFESQMTALYDRLQIWSLVVEQYYETHQRCPFKGA